VLDLAQAHQDVIEDFDLGEDEGTLFSMMQSAR
jgi:hypothetical protein